MYLDNPSVVSYRVKKFLESIGIETTRIPNASHRAMFRINDFSTITANRPNEVFEFVFFFDHGSNRPSSTGSPSDRFSSGDVLRFTFGTFGSNFSTFFEFDDPSIYDTLLDIPFIVNAFNLIVSAGDPSFSVLQTLFNSETNTIDFSLDVLGIGSDGVRFDGFNFRHVLGTTTLEALGSNTSFLGRSIQLCSRTFFSNVALYRPLCFRFWLSP